VFLYAFDLIELNGDDMRRDPLEVRKATLADDLAAKASGSRVIAHGGCTKQSLRKTLTQSSERKPKPLSLETKPLSGVLPAVAANPKTISVPPICQPWYGAQKAQFAISRLECSATTRGTLVPLATVVVWVVQRSRFHVRMLEPARMHVDRKLIEDALRMMRILSSSAGPERSVFRKWVKHAMR
jgi:hypothetical protein